VAEYLQARAQPGLTLLLPPDDVLRLLQGLRPRPARLDTRPVCYPDTLTHYTLKPLFVSDENCLCKSEKFFWKRKRNGTASRCLLYTFAVFAC
jgi:hypothetical protein